MAKLDFWYEFASMYSYLAAMRIEQLAAKAGVAMRWRPFLLGPIFKQQGWNTSPFNLYPAKGSYMLLDLARQCEDMGLPNFMMPKPFPANSLLAARVALALGDTERPDFSRTVYLAEFAEEKDIGNRDVIAEILKKLGHDAERVLVKAGEQAVKDMLRANTAEAMKISIFGAPTFVTDEDELFWGNDRLEQALAWAKK
ncbi:MAG TPA: 2-hydroxychromene-2-carboxylate isomerase [Xanthobacteraceae bacterium]|nr:2-hydroxychromene-2-carboxylate isomerase [Xanthobacteraceae bacterium]